MVKINAKVIDGKDIFIYILNIRLTQSFMSFKIKGLCFGLF